jgi:hypothetical protein
MKLLSEVNSIGIPCMAVYMLPLGFLAARLIHGRYFYIFRA